MSDTQLQLLVLALAVISLVLVVVVVAMLRQIGRILLRMGDEPAELMPTGGPAFEAEVALPDTDISEGALVMFVSSSCAACTGVTMALPEIREAFPSLNLVLAVVDEDPEARRVYAEKLGVGARSDLYHLMEDWAIPGTPFAVAVGSDSRVHSKGVITSIPQIASVSEHLSVSSRGQHLVGAEDPS